MTTERDIKEMVDKLSVKPIMKVYDSEKYYELLFNLINSAEIKGWNSALQKAKEELKRQELCGIEKMYCEGLRRSIEIVEGLKR